MPFAIALTNACDNTVLPGGVLTPIASRVTTTATSTPRFSLA